MPFEVLCPYHRHLLHDYLHLNLPGHLLNWTYFHHLNQLKVIRHLNVVGYQKFVPLVVTSYLPRPLQQYPTKSRPLAKLLCEQGCETETCPVSI